MLVNDLFVIENGVLKAFTGPDAEVKVPEGVHTIGEGVFKGMAWILKVSLPASLKKIGAAAFKGCRQLKEINFPEGLAEIGEYAFHRCHGIEEMVFPKSMTQVGNHAFLYCDNLKRVVIEGPERLGKAVFSHNLLLQDITLNKNVDDSNFNDEVFEGCVNLKRITLSGETYEIDNLIEVMGSRSEYPQVIRSIAKGVYHTMQIEDGVLNKYSINLKSVFLPEGITAIGKSCFFDKKGIVKITFPGSLREIKANAFLNCISLEEITFQSGDVILDDKAFRGCNNLKQVHLQGKTYLLEDETPIEMISRIRDQVLGDFYISGKTLIRYTGSEEQIRIPKGVEIIGECCFFRNEQLKTVLCPDCLSEIREQAFEGCLTLQNIVLPETLRRVEREAFAECRKLLKCNLPASLEYIGEYAFRRCFTLKPFEPWPENAEIHEYAFYLAKQFEEDVKDEKAEKDERDERTKGNSSAEDETKPGQDSIIAPYAYAGKGGIKVLTLSGIKRIGKYAYASCTDLEEIVIDAPE
ncbi:MAG: leucine-rich repeat domain-containing protein, partial [Lachnospiraceae bacterium]|nr:leucine-rich repeat domain-containing protein [Lachnospiraceae bacterium]